MAKTAKPPRPPKYSLADRLNNPVSDATSAWTQASGYVDLQTAIGRLRNLLGKDAMIKEDYTKETILPLLALDGVDHSSEISKFWARETAYIISLDPDRAVYRTSKGSFYMIQEKWSVNVRNHKGMDALSFFAY